MKNGLLLAVAVATAGALGLPSCTRRARRGGEWTTSGFDAQRTGWLRSDPRISLADDAEAWRIWTVQVPLEIEAGARSAGADHARPSRSCSIS